MFYETEQLICGTKLSLKFQVLFYTPCKTYVKAKYGDKSAPMKTSE